MTIDRAAEARRMEEAIAEMDTPRMRCAFRNARRICKRSLRRSPNWVLASELFGLGSTYSHALCRRFGVDPEAVE